MAREAWFSQRPKKKLKPHFTFYTKVLKDETKQTGESSKIGQLLRVYRKVPKFVNGGLNLRYFTCIRRGNFQKLTSSLQSGAENLARSRMDSLIIRR